jgi:ABC-type multidrug transport system ATPase subunit
MEALKTLTESGHTIVASIHQPRSRIFDLFDDLLLLSNGALLYNGPADGALAHFESLGHTCPPHHNPAEFLADIISIDNSSDQAAEDSTARFRTLVEGAKGS